MFRYLDLDDILFCVIMFIEALLLPYIATGHLDAEFIPLLVRKWEKEIVRFMEQYIDRSSASVQSEAIVDVCIFTGNNIATQLHNPQFDCIDLLCGNIFPNKESEKKTECVGRIYSSDCLGESVYLIVCDGPCMLTG